MHYRVGEFRRHEPLGRQVYHVREWSACFSTVQRDSSFDLFRSKFLRVCHFHGQRCRSPRDRFTYVKYIYSEGERERKRRKKYGMVVMMMVVVEIESAKRERKRIWKRMKVKAWIKRRRHIHKYIDTADCYYWLTHVFTSRRGKKMLDHGTIEIHGDHLRFSCICFCDFSRLTLSWLFFFFCFDHLCGRGLTDWLTDYYWMCSMRCPLFIIRFLRKGERQRKEKFFALSCSSSFFFFFFFFLSISLFLADWTLGARARARKKEWEKEKAKHDCSDGHIIHWTANDRRLFILFRLCNPALRLESARSFNDQI